MGLIDRSMMRYEQTNAVREESVERERERKTERGKEVLGNITEPPTRQCPFLFPVECCLLCCSVGFRFLHFFPSLSGMLLKRASERAEENTSFKRHLQKSFSGGVYFFVWFDGWEGKGEPWDWEDRVCGCVAYGREWSAKRRMQMVERKGV